MALALNYKNIGVGKVRSTSTVLQPNRNTTNVETRRCLFGPANPEDTYRLAKENLEREGQRFFMRFGITMEDLDRVAITEDEYKKLRRRTIVQPVGPIEEPSCTVTPRLSSGGGKIIGMKLARLGRALQPYNRLASSSSARQHQLQPQQQQQMKMTDFCQVKKSPTSSLQPLEKKLPTENEL